MDETKQEQKAAELAQAIKNQREALRSPACKEMWKLRAEDRRMRYLAYREAGFDENQSLYLCQQDGS